MTPTDQTKLEREGKDKDTARMDWIEKHVEQVVLRTDTLPLSFRENWEGILRKYPNRRAQIDAAMQQPETPQP